MQGLDDVGKAVAKRRKSKDFDMGVFRAEDLTDGLGEREVHIVVRAEIACNGDMCVHRLRENLFVNRETCSIAVVEKGRRRDVVPERNEEKE